MLLRASQQAAEGLLVIPHSQVTDCAVFFHLQACRSAKPSGGSNGSHGWPIPSLRWVTGKEWLPGALNLFPVNDTVHDQRSSPEKDAEEIEEATDECVSIGINLSDFVCVFISLSFSLTSLHPKDGSSYFSETEGVVGRPQQTRGGNRQDRKLQRYRAQRLACHYQGDVRKCQPSSSSERLSQSTLTEQPSSYKSFISQVPLRLLIKVSGQRGGLGISIAGGKGSLPYKENDEGIFISRVSKGGPAEKAGVHIGDRVLEVNGQDMLEVSHHEAVSALRNAGNCIKMKVLRERPAPPPDNRAPQEPDISEADISRQWIDTCQESMLDCSPLANRIEAVICNGKGLIPRIILTHPSTSDEDVEPLNHDTDAGDFDDDPDDHIYSDLKSAFYLP
ncbi:uncharacterized protein [Salminus brasiliensis]|uniref:uncharacterized protein n=1 Tax=Salminus brasiliensis TaxID=930266 RepID=UPI003B830BEA